MIRNTLIMGCVLALIGTLAGCGEKERVVVYKQGRYQGKPDTEPYANQAFGNDRAKWENAIRARGEYQNEYKRVGS